MCRGLSEGTSPPRGGRGRQGGTGEAKLPLDHGISASNGAAGGPGGRPARSSPGSQGTGRTDVRHYRTRCGGEERELAPNTCHARSHTAAGKENPRRVAYPSGLHRGHLHQSRSPEASVGSEWSSRGIGRLSGAPRLLFPPTPVVCGFSGESVVCLGGDEGSRTW